MKKVLVLLAISLVCVTAFGDNAVPVNSTFVPPEWLQSVLLWLKGMPVVGPILVTVCMWAGVVAGIMTAASAFVMAVGRSLSQVLNIAKMADAASKVKTVTDKALPVLMYLSMFNVQKKVDAKPDEVIMTK